MTNNKHHPDLNLAPREYIVWVQRGKERLDPSTWWFRKWPAMVYFIIGLSIFFFFRYHSVFVDAVPQVLSFRHSPVEQKIRQRRTIYFFSIVSLEELN